MERVREFCELNSRFVEEVSDHPTARHDLVGAVERGELPDTARFLERLHPDCQWFVTEVPRRAHRGKEALLRMVESWLEVTTDWRAVHGDITEGENAFVIEMVVTGRGRASGAPTRTRGWAVVTMRDGLVETWREFTDWEEARRLGTWSATPAIVSGRGEGTEGPKLCPELCPRLPTPNLIEPDRIRPYLTQLDLTRRFSPNSQSGNPGSNPGSGA
jgi:ketosteroid isomerase-like protein